MILTCGVFSCAEDAKNKSDDKKNQQGFCSTGPSPKQK